MGKTQNSAEYDKTLRACQSKRTFVKIGITVTEEEACLNGIILAFSDELIHLAESENFKFNGEAIISMLVRFNDAYSTTFRKYLKQPRRSKKKGS